MDKYLMHYGVLGMKWGVRRSRSNASTSGGKRRSRTSLFSKKAATKKKIAKKSAKDMTDDELRKAIERLELEKKYDSFSSKKVNKGKDFVAKVIEKSGENIATQLTTYAMGTAVNKIAGGEIVNPKKGQKDK
nr:MAG TPA: Structural protein [Caudoviricetes sp.]